MKFMLLIFLFLLFFFFHWIYLWCSRMNWWMCMTSVWVLVHNTFTHSRNRNTPEFCWKNPSMSMAIKLCSAYEWNMDCRENIIAKDRFMQTWEDQGFFVFFFFRFLLLLFCFAFGCQCDFFFCLSRVLRAKNMTGPYRDPFQCSHRLSQAIKYIFLNWLWR